VTIILNLYNFCYIINNFSKIILMNNIYFYLLLGVLLYFLFTRVLERFSQEQENFDPSLVPVSSIVTLAKVAQKLVNGNGTLTNPGNLQIGANADTPGNLTVTGNTTVGGGLTINGSLSPNGGFNGRGINASIGNINIGPNLISNTDTGSNLLIGSSGKKVQIWSSDLDVDKDLRVGGTTTSTGLLTANGGVKTSTLDAGAMTNLTDLKATGNIALATNPAANGVTIGSSPLSTISGTGGLAMSGNLYVGGATTVTGSITTATSPGGGIYIAPRGGSGQTFAWYNQDGTKANLWNASGGDVLTVDTGGNLKVKNSLCIQDTCLSDPFSIKVILQPIIRRGQTNNNVARYQYTVNDTYPCSLIDGGDGGSQSIYQLPAGEYVNLYNPDVLDIWPDGTVRQGKDWPTYGTTPNTATSTDAGLQRVGRGYFSNGGLDVRQADYIVLKTGYTAVLSMSYYPLLENGSIEFKGNNTFTHLNSIYNGLVNTVNYIKIRKD